MKMQGVINVVVLLTLASKSGAILHRLGAPESVKQGVKQSEGATVFTLSRPEPASDVPTLFNRHPAMSTPLASKHVTNIYKCKPFTCPVMCEKKNRTTQEVLFSQDCATSGDAPFSECVELDTEKFQHPIKHLTHLWADLDLKFCKAKLCTDDADCGAESKCVEKKSPPKKGGNTEEANETEETKQCQISCPWRLFQMACKVVNGTTVSTRPCMYPSMTCNEYLSETVTLQGHQLSLSFCEHDGMSHQGEVSRMQLCNECQDQSKPLFGEKFTTKLNADTVFCGTKNNTSGEECEDKCNEDLFPFYKSCSPLDEANGAVKICPLVDRDCKKKSDCGELMHCINRKCSPSCEVLLYQRACFIYNETSKTKSVRSCMDECNMDKSETIELNGHNYTLAFNNKPWISLQTGEGSAHWERFVENREAAELAKCHFAMRMRQKFYTIAGLGSTRSRAPSNIDGGKRVHGPNDPLKKPAGGQRKGPGQRVYQPVGPGPQGGHAQGHSKSQAANQQMGGWQWLSPGGRLNKG